MTFTTFYAVKGVAIVVGILLGIQWRVGLFKAVVVLAQEIIDPLD